MAEGAADIGGRPKGAITLRQQAYRGMGVDADYSVAKDTAILWRITRLIFKTDGDFLCYRVAPQ